jgi:hypothetical protein
MELGNCDHTRMVPLASLEITGPSLSAISLARAEEHQVRPLNSSIGVDWRTRLIRQVACRDGPEPSRKGGELRVPTSHH